jgi:hypothetical protein
MRTATILFSIILLASCRTKTITETTIIERVDTAVAIPPSVIDFERKLPELITPQTTETERAKITVLHDTVTNTIRVETFIKPDTIVVQKEIIRTQKITEKKRQPVKRWRWFVAGFIAAIVLRVIIRVYGANLTKLPRI